VPLAGEPSHFEVGVRDAARAKAFYGELLDWSFETTPVAASRRAATTRASSWAFASPNRDGYAFVLAQWARSEEPIQRSAASAMTSTDTIVSGRRKRPAKNGHVASPSAAAIWRTTS
jgi:hypothetical protein